MWKLVNFGSAVFLLLFVVFQCFPSLISYLFSGMRNGAVPSHSLHVGAEWITVTVSGESLVIKAGWIRRWRGRMMYCEFSLSESLL